MTEKDIKRNLGKCVRFTNRHLCIEDMRFILTGATIRLGENGFFYQAELTDMHNNKSVLICRLEEIEPE